ncbi:Protein of unknown function [Anaerovirgula multivorans]|uniref:Uncharacterized protein n=1 Tax=Anaerovirgula multivorans TaxID=312168 RepID=A0A239KWS6_9FIRM|nr:DUF1307 domain-containing protein [Anaerovirgula multivorans]SNT22681.1 Protein of unknown function [Anaerovirgula multivorans]
MYSCFCRVSLIIMGCNKVEYNVTILRYEPTKTMVGNYEVEQILTIKIFHRVGVVNKSEIVEELFSNNEALDTIKEYKNQIKETYSNEIFNHIGFEHSSKIEDNSYTSTVVHNYNKVNMKELTKADNIFMYLADTLNENYEVTYEQLIKLYKDLGFVIEEIPKIN